MFACVTSGLRTPGVRRGSATMRCAGRECSWERPATTTTTRTAASRRSPRETCVATTDNVGGRPAQRKTLFRARLAGAVGSGDMAEIAVKPSGPYSLAMSARLAGDATRRFRDGVVAARCEGSVARAWQAPDGVVTIHSDSPRAAEKLRWVLALDDDHSEFLRRVADDPLLGRASKHLRGLRPVRTATVAQALLRAVCGQLVDWKTGRTLEWRVIRALGPAAADGLFEPPTTAALGAAAPFELRRLGLHERRGAAVVRLC